MDVETRMMTHRQDAYAKGCVRSFFRGSPWARIGAFLGLDAVVKVDVIDYKSIHHDLDLN